MTTPAKAKAAQRKAESLFASASDVLATPAATLRVRASTTEAPAEAPAQDNGKAGEPELPEAWKPPRRATASRPITSPEKMPVMGRGFDRVVEVVFDMSEAEVRIEYVAIEQSLSMKNAATPGALHSLAANVEEIARRALRLNIVAQYEFGRFERATDSIVGALRDVATQKLEEEKNAKLRTKQITEADIAEYAALLHPDEWHEVQDRRAKARGMLKYVEGLADLCNKRTRTVSAMLGVRGT